MTTINIDIDVKHGTAKVRLENLHKQMKHVGRATEDTARSFKNFNRTIFGATAFVGLFTQAFSSLGNTLLIGSELDRINNQFAKTFGHELPKSIKTFSDGTSTALGPQGSFIKRLREMTDNSVDIMSAMKSAIQLRTTGVSGDINELAEVVARASAAAKRVGKDSAEGIKRVTEFLKDGSLAHLQHLGLLRSVNPELKAQLSILNQSAGVLGTTVTAQYKLTLGLKVLRAATKGQLKGQRDLRDTLQDTIQYFDHLKRTIGTFIGTAIQPLLENFIDLSLDMTYILEDIKSNRKEIMFLAKAFMIGTAAVAGFLLTIGALKLGITALTSLVAGIPFFSATMLALGAAVLGSSFSFEGFINTLQKVGAVAKGVFQLVKSFLTDEENFAEGVGKMDKALHDFLQKEGLLNMTKGISQVIAAIGMFAKGVVEGFKGPISFILDKLGPLGDKLKKIFGFDGKPASEAILGIAKSIGKVTGGVLAAVAAFKLLKFGKGLLSKIPFIGRLFGGKKGGRGGPTGRAGDPLYVKLASAAANLPGVSGAILKNKFLGEVFTNPQGMKAGASAAGGSMFGNLAMKNRFLGEMATHPGGKMAGVRSALGGTKIGGIVTSFFSKFSRGLTIMLAGLSSTIAPTLINLFRTPLKTIPALLGTLFKGMAAAPRNIFMGLARLGPVLSGAGAALMRFIPGIFLVTTAFGFISDTINRAGETIDSWKSSWIETMNLGKSAFEWVKTVFSTTTVFDRLKVTFNSFIDMILKKFPALGEAWDKVKEAVKISKSYISNLVSKGYKIAEGGILVLKDIGGKIIDKINPMQLGKNISEVGNIGLQGGFNYEAAGKASLSKFFQKHTTEMKQKAGQGTRNLLLDPSTGKVDKQSTVDQANFMKQDVIQETIKGYIASVDKSQRAALRGAFIQAQETTSPGGSAITASEMRGIFGLIERPLAATAENTSKIAGKSDDTKTAPGSVRGGSC